MGCWLPFLWPQPPPLPLPLSLLVPATGRPSPQFHLQGSAEALGSKSGLLSPLPHPSSSRVAQLLWNL